MKKLMVLLMLVVLAGSVALAQPLTVLTEEWPPYNYLENGKPVGMSTEIVQEIQKRLGINYPIVTQPWPRSYDAIQKSDNQVLYSMTYTESRKPLFKWVGPLVDFNSSYFAKKGSNIKITSFEDGKKVSKLGIAAGTPDEDMTKSANFTNIDLAVDVETIVKKLIAGRDDLILAPDYSVMKSLVKIGSSPNDVINVFTVSRRPLYIAFSKNVPDSVIAQWQKALDSIKADGTLNKIVAKYLNN